MKWTSTNFASSRPCISLTIFTAAFLLTTSPRTSAAKSNYFERMNAASQIISQVMSGAYANRLVDAAEDIRMVETAVFQLSKPEMQSAILQSLEHLSDGASAVGETEGLREGVLGVGDESSPAQNTTSELCLNHTVATFIGLLNRESWAKQMLDAMGKPSPGIMEGNIIWPGAYKMCFKVRANTSVAAQPDFSGQYCTASIPMGPELVPQFPVLMSLGLCVPDTCSGMDLTFLLKDVLARLNKTQLSPQVNCNQQARPLDTKAIVAIVICSIFLFLMVVGTAIDVICVQWPKWKFEEQRHSPSAGFNDLGEHTPLLLKPETAAALPTELGTCTKLILAFSVYTNGAKLLSTKRTPGSLDCVHGFRFFSMIWVVLGHAVMFPLLNASNTAPYLKEAVSRWTFQGILSAPLSVDSFFVLSGLLVAYLSLKEMKKKGGKINWLLFYFHRFWRLTPVYMLVIMIYTCLTPCWVEGPFNVPYVGRDSCTWWTNLLYINNIVKSDKMCLGQSWYLANDMQFYILSPLIFVPLFFSPLLGAISAFIFILATTITPGVLSKEYNLGPSFVTGLVQVNSTDANQHDFVTDYYFRPYNRMSPYVIGMLTGYFLYRTDCKLRINKFLNLLLWALAAACALAVLYGLYDAYNGHPITLSVAALYNALNKQVWSLSVCWVIIACVTGNGGFVNTILSWPALIPLSRLTYCVYLIQVVSFEVSLLNRKTTFYMDDVNIVMYFLSILVVSYMLAMITSLAFESPMMALEKVIFHSRSSETSKKIKFEGVTDDRAHVIT